MKVNLKSRATILTAAGAIVVVVILAAALVVVAKPGAAAQASLTASPTASATIVPSPSATPTEEPSAVESALASATALPAGWAYSDLDGVAAPADLAHRLPVAVMVDDNSVARPQSGFSFASIVYQAPADGGEDRYMMVFQEGTSSDIGPVRSARPYFVYWAAEYKAGYAHYGGDLLSVFTTIPAMAPYIYNMDALNGFSCPYHRIATRVAPHNAYTNSSELIRCAAKVNYPTTYQNLPTRPFTTDAAPADRAVAQTINIPYHSGAIGYQYDARTDSYKRSVDGKPQFDPANNQAVYARNVVVMYQALSYDNVTDPTHNRPVVANVGTGSAVVFKDGHAIAATWKKLKNETLTRFYDSAGSEIPLLRGSIYIQCVPITTKVTYN